MNYNYIAPYYDLLSRICFLNQQQKAHQIILEHLKPNAKILWLGGGSGWFLPKIDQLRFNLSIDYVEVSLVMLTKAKQKKLKNTSVHFIEEDILKFNSDQKYDVIITAFIFDHFKREECELMFNRFNENLKTNGKWIYIDFCENQTKIQRCLTRAMVLFFNVVAGIKAKDFPKVDDLFNNFKMLAKRAYFLKYIEAKVYVK